MVYFLTHHFPFFFSTVLIAMLIKRKSLSIFLGASLLPFSYSIFNVILGRDTNQSFHFLIISYLTITSLFLTFILIKKKLYIWSIIPALLFSLNIYPQPSVVENLIDKNIYHKITKDELLNFDHGSSFYSNLNEIYESNNNDSSIIMYLSDCFNMDGIKIRIDYQNGNQIIRYKLQDHDSSNHESKLLDISNWKTINKHYKFLVDSINLGLESFYPDRVNFVSFDGYYFEIDKMNYLSYKYYNYDLSNSSKNTPNGYKVIAPCVSLFKAISECEFAFKLKLQKIGQSGFIIEEKS